MMKIALTPLFVAFALIVIVGLMLAGGLRAVAGSFSPVQQAKAARTDALTAETVRHTNELNLIDEQHVRDLAPNKLATAVSAETAWRNLYAYGSGALILMAVTLALGRVARETTSFLAWREVEQRRSENPAWSPAGPMLLSRCEGGREKLLCQLSGATAFVDEPEAMLIFIKARVAVVPGYLESLAMAQRDVALEAAKGPEVRKAKYTLPHPIIDVQAQGL